MKFKDFTVKDLKTFLEKMPQDHKIKIEVDSMYTANIKSIFVNSYEKENGNKVVTIRTTN